MSSSQHIALVPEAGGVNPSQLARVCAALQKQVTRDFAPIWGVHATVNAFPSLDDLPLGYWPIVITFGELGDQAGVHIDRNGQPFAQVEMSPGWSLAASQACLDMLINPFGRRLTAGPSPRPDQGPVDFLLEVVAPCSDLESAYMIDEVLVSDFCIPAFWGASAAVHQAYSFTGAIREPHQVVPGGHIAWHEPVTDKWWLRHHLEQTLVDSRIGSLDASAGVVREAMRVRTPQAMHAARMSVAEFEGRLGVRRHHAIRASQHQAQRLRGLMVGADSEPTRDSLGTTLNDAHLPPGPSRSWDSSEEAEEAEVEVSHTELLDDEQVIAEYGSLRPGAPPRGHFTSRPPPLPEGHVATLPPLAMSPSIAPPPGVENVQGRVLAVAAVAAIALAAVLFTRGAPSAETPKSPPAAAAPASPPVAPVATVTAIPTVVAAVPAAVVMAPVTARSTPAPQATEASPTPTAVPKPPRAKSPRSPAPALTRPSNTEPDRPPPAPPSVDVDPAEVLIGERR